jgi:hypothetical protein
LTRIEAKLRLGLREVKQRFSVDMAAPFGHLSRGVPTLSDDWRSLEAIFSTALAATAKKMRWTKKIALWR